MNSINKNDSCLDSTEFAMPLNTAYISKARTTASSMAEKMNFSNSKIEDIKTAVSETVTLFINNSVTKDSDSQFKIKFTNKTDELRVQIDTSMKCVKEDKEDLSLKLIKGCMDDVNLVFDNDSLVSVDMIKKNN